jgi:hypothetical protein
MRESDRLTNETAKFSPCELSPSPDDPDTCSYPAVRIGDVTVFVYSDDGVVCVTVDLDETSDDSPFAIFPTPGLDVACPVEICVGGTVVFRSGPEGETSLVSGEMASLLRTLSEGLAVRPGLLDELMGPAKARDMAALLGAVSGGLPGLRA